jgi:hypothetical protein
MVEYPGGPCPPTCIPSIEKAMAQGEGIAGIPFECQMSLEITSPMGGCTKIVGGLLSQLGKWGFVRVQVDRSIEVSPVFTEYYQKTIAQKKALEAEIKNGFASLSKAIEEYELLLHDLRKYKEYLNYFKELEEAKKKKDPEAIKRAEHVLRAMFVDLVDVHTGEGLSMRSIAPRWPTVIADFMQLTDEDIEAKKIMDKLKVPRAEAEILVTKNRLYIEWRNMFKEMVIERYERLKGLTEARKKSIEEYREILRVNLSRFKAIKEMRETSKGRKFLETLSIYQPHAQAMSLDEIIIWAWKPFAPEEKYKFTREALDKVDARLAGFTDEEIKEYYKIKPDWDGKVPGLPVLPIVDKHVRNMIKDIEKEYKVKITVEDIIDTIKELEKRYIHPEPGPGATERGEKWVFSPYFVFIEFVASRLVIKFPDGSMLEDIDFNPIRSWTITQNVLIGRMLELKARHKELEREMGHLLGEWGIVEKEKMKKIEEILKEEYPEFYGGEEEKEEVVTSIQLTISKIKDFFNNIRNGIANFFRELLGVNLLFLYAGPYEKVSDDRLTEFYYPHAGRWFAAVKRFIQQSAGVPGIKW